ncbi:MAG TPA: SAF domain-containing protein, partial [Thermoanaerobaculia bacterium]|nr:SAF domain-containing protein [Thermoanaerobaculia bacterium]
MSSRRRSLAFLVGAALAAASAAAIAEGYGSSVARGYGPLRPVVVAVTRLERGRAIDLALAREELEVRRVPARFLPPGALADPAEALGLVPLAAVPAGSYLLASQLRPPRSGQPGRILERGRRPVAIAVSGAGALLGGGADSAGARVDVVVTTEPSAGGAGRAYVAAAGVPLLAL